MTNKEIVKGFFQKAYEEQDYDFVMEYFSEDYLDHSPAGAKSNKQAVEILKGAAKTFEQVKVEVLDLFEENGLVGVRILFQGMHVGEFAGVAPTGKKITFEALEHFKLVNGKVTESWGYWPDMEIVNKLKA